LNYAAASDATPRRWAELPTGQPPAMYFWYRQSPQLLIPTGMGLRVYPGRVTPSDPPPLDPGMATVFLDLRGRLIEFTVVPGREPPGVSPAAEVDWKAAFAEAKLDWGRATRTTPEWAAPVIAARSEAWEVPSSESPARPLRVEAAAYQGKVVF